MSESERLGLVAVSVQSAKPSYRYGQIARPPVKAGAAYMLVRAGIPADIPVDAVVTKADLVFFGRSARTGSRTMAATKNATSFSVSKATWKNRPAVTGVGATTTVGAVPAGSAVTISVVDDVQGFISGTLVNRGWRITTTETDSGKFYGATAASRKPYLDIEYVLPSVIPVNLSPDGGAVSVAKPTLTFTTPDDTVAIRVLIDPAADAVAPDWDSGEKPSSAGLLDLATTTYPGLALDATTAWAAYAKTSLGWSPISEWAEFSRAALPVVTVTGPAATSGDKTPPVTWTAPAQVTWQVLLYDANTGAKLADSGRVTSADLEWTPPKGLTKVGQRGRVEVRVWDAVDRVQTKGDTTYGFDTQEFDLVAAGAAEGVTTLTASLVNESPAIRLAWAAVTADEWQVVRDGEWLDRIDGSLREFYDYTARPNHLHEYRVFPVSNGVVSPNGPFATIMPTCTGIWLIDPDDGAQVLLLGQDAGSFDMVEQSVTHNVLGAAPVRRRAGILPPSGAISGGIYDALDLAADDIVATLYDFKNGDPGHVYRLILGDWNMPVTIGDVKVQPTPQSGPEERMYVASLSWWQTADELPWDA